MRENVVEVRLLSTFSHFAEAVPCTREYTLWSGKEACLGKSGLSSVRYNSESPLKAAVICWVNFKPEPK